MRKIPENSGKLKKYGKNMQFSKKNLTQLKEQITIFFHLLQNRWENDNRQKCHWHVNQDIRTAQHHHIPDYLLAMEVVVANSNFQASDQMNQGIQHEDKRQ